MSKSYKSTKSLRKGKKNIVLWAGAIGAAVVAIGGGVGYFLLTRQPPQGILGLAAAIPQDAEVAIAFNAESDPWQKLAQFGTPDSQKLLGQMINQSPVSTILTESNTNFDTDVKPWLGTHIITAQVPDSPQPNSAVSTLVIASTSDRNLSNNFLTKYREALAKQGAIFQQKEYKDFKFYESPTKVSGRSVVTADIDGKYVAIATSASLIQRTFDTYKREQPSLAQKTIFTNIFSTNANSKIAKPLAQVYLDGSIALEFIGSQSMQTFSEPVLEQSRQQLDAIALAVGTQKEGIRLELDTYFKNPSPEPPPELSSQVLTKLPQETFLLISGSNLAKSWQFLLEQSKSNSNSQQVISQIREAVKKSLQLDLDRDILKWMTGEFAIAALPANQGILANAGFGLVVLSQTSDRAATTKVLTALDGFAKAPSGGVIPAGVTANQKKLGDKQITAWQAGKVTLATNGFLSDDYAYFAMSDLAELLIPSPNKTLPESRAFAILTTDLPKNNGGYFYLNMTNALIITDKLMPTEAKSNENYVKIRAVLDAIRGIAVTNTALDNRTIRLDLLFTLKPTPGN